MKKILSIVGLLFLLTFAFQTANAQSTAQVIDTTRPISPELRAALNAWLSTDNPSDALYYVVTYTQPQGADVLVSLAGFDDVTNGWSITGDARGISHVVWLGTVIVAEDDTVTIYIPNNHQSYTPLMAGAIFPFSPLFAGGNIEYRFPFDRAKSAQYGVLGVHAAGYSGSGMTGNMVAVDLVSGTDLGVGFASPWVWNSAPGEIVYVCEDDDSTAVILESPNDDKFLYAHLLNNESLYIGRSYGDASLGVLKSGSFGEPNEGCGWAEQSPNHYHLHWGIEPASGVFRTESCVLRVNTGIWTCGNATVAPGEYFTSRGIDDVTDPYSSPTLFDYLMIGVLNIYDEAIVQHMPEGTGSFALITPIMNTMSIVFRVLNVLVMGNLNCVPAIGLLLIAITFRTGLGVLWLVGAILRTIKSLPFA